MPYGRSGGYSRHRFSHAPYRFGSRVKDVIGDHKHHEATLVEPTEDKASYSVFAGSDDSCFLLPGTELCSSQRRDDNTVLATGAGLRFEAVGSWKYSIQVICFRHSL